MAAALPVSDSVALATWLGASPPTPARNCLCPSPQNLSSFCSDTPPSCLPGLLQEIQAGEMDVTEQETPVSWDVRAPRGGATQPHYTEGHTEAAKALVHQGRQTPAGSPRRLWYRDGLASFNSIYQERLRKDLARNGWFWELRPLPRSLPRLLQGCTRPSLQTTRGVGPGASQPDSGLFGSLSPCHPRKGDTAICLLSPRGAQLFHFSKGDDC